MKDRIKSLVFSTAIVVLAAVAVAFAANHFRSKSAYSESMISGFAMGTSYKVVYFGPDSQGVSKDIADYIERTDKESLSHRIDGSTIAKINNRNNEDVFNVDDMTAYRCISSSIEICEKTNGAVDITARPLIELWGIETKTTEDFKIPDDASINKALSHLNYKELAILGDNKLQFLDSELQLDLGAVAKGYMLDLIYDEYLSDRKDNTSALIQAGGSTMVVGTKSDGSSWKIGIRDPFGDIDDVICHIEFSKSDMKTSDKLCISTSGDYEKFIEVDGVRYHHILSPYTGYPVQNELTSVTVVCSDGLSSDALSTAFFVMGEEEAIKYIEANKEDGIEAVFIRKDGSINVTSGLKEKVFQD